LKELFWQQKAQLLQSRARINHILPKTRLPGYIVVTDRMSSSVNFAQLPPKAAVLCEIAHNDSH